LNDGTPNAHIWEFGNGVFVSLCLNPLGCKPGVPLDHSAMFNLQWLHKELGGKGALCGWDLDHATGSNAEAATKGLSAAQDDVQSPVGFQTFSKLNDAELKWIRDCVNQAHTLAGRYLGTDAKRPLDPVTLDCAYRAWLAQWQSGNASEDPNVVVNCIGSAFGQWLVDSLGMTWTVVADANGTDMGVSFGPSANRVLVFPTHAVARRLETRETGFIQELFEATRNQIERREQ
jgi:hypothetical protein